MPVPSFSPTQLIPTSPTLPLLLLLLLLLPVLQVLVHLCYVLPPPACYIYRDMKPNRMQRVLAQRAMLEKALRGHLVELVHQDQQLQRWLKTVSEWCTCLRASFSRVACRALFSGL